MAHSKKFEKYIEHVENKISDTDALAGLNKKRLLRHWKWNTSYY